MNPQQEVSNGNQTELYEETLIKTKEEIRVERGVDTTMLTNIPKGTAKMGYGSNMEEIKR